MAPGTSPRNIAQKPRLFNGSELRRFEDCANENETLADCWAGNHIVIVACELSDRYQYADQRNSRAIEINVMSPADKPIWRSLPLDDKKHDAFKKHCSTRTIRMLEKSKVNKSLQPKPWSWYNAAAAHETFELYEEEARAKAQEAFDALGGPAYATVCVVSYDLRETMAALELFKVRLPSSKVVFVDLIKVLEHQTRGEGVIPEQLRKYTNGNIAMRNGKLDRRPGAPRGYLGMPSIRLLEVVGLAAESHRADHKKLEKGNLALERITKRIRNG